MLEGQGLDPLNYLVLPRVLGLMISVCCLTVVFTAMSFLGVYLSGQWIGAKTGSFGEFCQNTLAGIGPADVMNLILKGVIPPLLAGCECCARVQRRGYHCPGARGRNDRGAAFHRYLVYRQRDDIGWHVSMSHK